MQLLQRTYPGQLPTVRRDIHNIILPLDLREPKDTELLVENLQNFVKRKVPIRFGVVPIAKTTGAVKQVKVVYYLVETYGLKTAIEYLQSVSLGGL